MSDWFSWWLSGFFDAEGSFGIRKMPKTDVFSARLSISLRDDDREILERIMDHLGCGRIHTNSKKRGTSNPQSTFEVDNSLELVERIIPFFDKYSLRAKKRLEYPAWRQLVLLGANIKRRKIRRNPNGPGSLSKWLPLEKILCSQLTDEVRSFREYKEDHNKEPIAQKFDDRFKWWLTGFTDGEGCFRLSTTNRGSSWFSAFCIGVRADDKPIIDSIAEYLCFNTTIKREKKKNPVSSILIRSVDGIRKVESHFDNHPLQSRKRLDYPIWKDGVSICGKIAGKKITPLLDGKGGFGKVLGTKKKWDKGSYSRMAGLRSSLDAVREYKEKATPQ